MTLSPKYRLPGLYKHLVSSVVILVLSPTYCGIHGPSISPTRVSSARGTCSVPVFSARGTCKVPATRPGPTSRSNPPGYPRRGLPTHAGDYPTLTVLQPLNLRLCLPQHFDFLTSPRALDCCATHPTPPPLPSMPFDFQPPRLPTPSPASNVVQICMCI